MKRFVLTDAEVWELGEASKPRVLTLSDQRTPQELAEEVWKKLGQKYGFFWNTVQRDTSTKDKGTILAQEFPTIPGETRRGP